jgi:beta-xylosidase
MPAPAFRAETILQLAAGAIGERAGLIVFGDSYAWVGVEKTSDGWRVRQVAAIDARTGGAEVEAASAVLRSGSVHLRVDVSEGARCRFSYSEDGAQFTPLGEVFQATVGRWIGSKVGLFAVAAAGAPKVGHADFERFAVSSIGDEPTPPPNLGAR